MENIEQESKVTCQVCGEQFPIITPSHLKQKHGISLAIYREKYPDSPITSIEYKARQRYLKGNLFVKDDQDPIVDKIDFTKLQLNKDDNLDIENIVKFQKSKVNVEQAKDTKGIPLRKFNVLPGKKVILDFLQTVFPPNSVINNYMIDIISLDGRLTYQTITDIAIPYKKIDFEFPKVFWHNCRIQDPFRNFKLEREGWIVITVNSMPPTIDEVRKYLEHRKLI